VRIALTVIAALVVYRTKWNPIWLIFGSAALGLASAVTGTNIF
jgi:mannose/fructose/N-acetylgalactosamine-specific phosphotransferase system component IID